MSPCSSSSAVMALKAVRFAVHADSPSSVNSSSMAQPFSMAKRRQASSWASIE